MPVTNINGGKISNLSMVNSIRRGIMREMKNLDFFLVESVDKDLDVWGDTVLAVVHESQ